MKIDILSLALGYVASYAFVLIALHVPDWIRAIRHKLRRSPELRTPSASIDVVTGISRSKQGFQ